MNLISSLQPLSREPGKERVFARCVRDENGCLVWQGGCNSKGYGCIGFDGRSWLTHRLVYEAVKGRIPDGLQIDHLCRNRKCSNPDHLEAVTAQENVKREERCQVTHCPHGHEYTPENTKLKRRSNGASRECRACYGEWQRKFRVRKPSTIRRGYDD